MGKKSMRKSPLQGVLAGLLVVMGINISCSDATHKPDPRPLDPLFKNQWHLSNTGQGGGIAGMDINVLPVWDRGIYGEGITIAIVDDGLEYTHEDLADNVIQSLNYNYLSSTTPINSGQHGTSVAGVSAATHNNYTGGIGAAPESNLAGYNLLMAYDDVNEHDAMIRYKNSIDISNNSWGPQDGSGQLMSSTYLWQQGIEEGIATGRNGRGIVYMWAAGNGARLYKTSTAEIDNSNYDGYANFYGVTALCAITDEGKRSYYSEKGANLWVCTYSSGGVSGITTTDLTGSYGYDSGNYTNRFGGTSSAAPLACGIAALILNANPNLTWRDVKMILARTARKIDPGDADWTVNGAGYPVNHAYGFGSIDADAAVNLALIWTNIGPLVNEISPVHTLGTAITDYSAAGISDSIVVAGSGISSLEYVSVSLDISHSDAGDLEISLTSPAGTVSVLAEQHQCYSTTIWTPVKCGYFGGAGAAFTFGTARHLDEPANGTWTLTVKDLASGDTGTLKSWVMTFYGR